MTVTPTTPRVGSGLLADRLLIQCGPDDVERVLPLLRDGSGLVVTGKEAARAAARARRCTNLPVLADRGRYAGASRVPAAAGVSAAWADAQLDTGSPLALTDSGYVAAGDRAGLAAVLAGTARLGPGSVAVLALHRGWLSTGLDVLVSEIDAHGVPVALVVEHPDDPFGQLATVRGLARLLDSAAVPVTLLRSDISALGAVAHGAVAGAFGVRSSLRHLHEPPKPGRGFRPPNTVATALWKPGLYMVKVDRLAAAHARTPDEPLWCCECSVCRGRPADWLHLDASEGEVLAHTLELVLDARDGLASLPAGPLRRMSWTAMCQHAEFQFQSAAAHAVRWQVPPAIRWWQRA